VNKFPTVFPRDPADRGRTLDEVHSVLAGEGTPRDFAGPRAWLLAHPQFEGIVWHHPDGRRAKPKHRDFATD
jgi:hypothetical protein